ncbi:MMPL family transporter [Nocardioides sp.]|uniref:MMPL family transporter n=1 Tax=Nocardioides sp. TaxID=35761 RepID=UPI002F40AACD
MARLLHRLGMLCARKPLIVIGAWVVMLVVVFGAVAKIGSLTSNDLSLPGTGSQEAKDLLQDKFPPQQNGANPIVFDITSGKLTDQQYTQAINDSVKAIKKQPHVYSVTNPLSSSGQTAGLLSKDKQTAFAPVLMDVASSDLTEEIAQNVVDAADPAKRAGIDVQAAGNIGTTLSTQESETSEVIGILVAMLILSLVLGSLVTMGMPILTAIVGLGAALSVVGLLGHVLAIPTSGPTLATMIGLGVGIDYALFLVTRHQEQLRDGMPMNDSIANAVATAGSAIVFAGGTVVIALLSLYVAGIPLVTALGLASAVGVVAAVLGAISLLPALLGLLKHRVHWVRLPRFLAPPHVPGKGMWHRWAGVVRRHPIIVSVVSLACLVPLIIPAFSLELGQEDVGATNPATTERKAYDLITAGFGVGFNGPLQVASQLEPAATPSAEYTQKYNKATSLQKQLEKDQKQLPKQQKQLEQQQKQLEAQQAKLTQQGNELKAQQASLTAQGDQLKAQQASLEQQGAQLQQQKARLEAQQRKLEEQQAALKKKGEALAAQIKPLATKLGRLEIREQVLRRRIEHAQGHPQRLARLHRRLDRVLQREAVVRQELAPLKRQAEQLAAQVRKLQAQAAALQRRADQLQAKADELNRRKAALEAQAASLQRQGDALQVQANKLQHQADALQAQGDQLQAEAEELKQKQKQAQQQQQEALKLQDQLTAMVTAAGGDARGTDPRVVNLQSALTATTGVVSLTPPQLNKKGDVVLLSAVPSTSPASNATADLVKKVRSDVLPPVDVNGMTSFVGGYTASYVDLAALISARLLLVIGTVILLGFLLLMVAFRSLLIPLQAALTNLLSAAASFGVLTAVFQWGWGISQVGIDTPDSSVPIASYVPLMMFAVLFGLSMDYEVFLVSHVQMHHHEGEEARQAVASGLGSSARITSAAALIMASVFASFILNGDPVIKQFGVGLATAVLLAGILVVTLAPALIVLFGKAAWWLPAWLDKVLPHISVEGETMPASDPTRADDGDLGDDDGDAGDSGPTEPAARARRE